MLTLSLHTVADSLADVPYPRTALWPLVAWPSLLLFFFMGKCVVCVHGYMHSHVWKPCACCVWRVEVGLLSFLHVVLPLIYWGRAATMVPHASKFVPGFPCLPSKHWNYKRPLCPHGTYLSSGDPNSDPHIGCLYSKCFNCWASPWPMDLLLPL